jgi:hypothetical protein
LQFQDLMAQLEDRDVEFHLPVAADLLSAAAPGVPDAARDLPRLIQELAKMAAAIGSREFYAVALA